MNKIYIRFSSILMLTTIICLFNCHVFAQELNSNPVASLANIPQQSSQQTASPLLQQLAEQAKIMQEQQLKTTKSNQQPVQRVPEIANTQASANNSTSIAQSLPMPNTVQNLNENTNNITAKQSGNLYNDAFDGVVDQMLPMTPEQIKKLRTLFNESQKAASMPVGVPQRPVTSSVLVNLSPQSTPPVIRLGAGYISSLVFMDSTGQAWPIQSYSIGDPSAFNIQWDQKGSTLLIQASSYYKRSNLAIMLKGLDTPVMLTLLSGQEVIDYRVDLRIPGMGPNAVVTQSNLPDSANPILLDVLNGIPPNGSKTLKVSGADAEAWLLKDRLFVRTSFEIISPAWKAIMNSADGTHAYELQPTPIILALQRGKDKTITLTLEGID